MSDATDAAVAAARQARIFLVVVDESEEMTVALRYASYRARNSGGRVALLYVVEPSDFQEWIAVEDIMREERRIEAEQVLQRLAKEVNKITGTLPVLYVREGEPRDELLSLIREEPGISILVLAAGTGPEGPGPLISYLAGKGLARMRIPVTIVPGSLTDEQLRVIT
jgi:nucleotide-binding universal stress UspA family protein